MLLWNSRPVVWTCAELGTRIYIAPEKLGELLRDLVRMQLIAESSAEPPRFSYVPRTSEQDELMGMLDTGHRHDLVRISTMIHAKATPGSADMHRVE